jgi:hypothetical protein
LNENALHLAFRTIKRERISGFNVDCWQKMYANRKALYASLETARGSKVIAYVTGDRAGMETEIHPEVYDLFVNHLDLIGVVKKISLYLYTIGGNTLAAWSLVNLIRQFCDTFEVVIPSKAYSSGTLIALGAQTVVMTKQARLGPIDPSVATPLNPPIPGANNNARYPVSVEAINGYLDLCKEKAGIKQSAGLLAVAGKLADHVHPLVLGQVHRAKSQIQMLARKLLTNEKLEKQKIEPIVKFLCSESGSHDYTIHRREALELGLPIVKPNDELYDLIKKIYDDVAVELEFRSKYDPNTLLGSEQAVQYRLRRGLIESVAGGSDFFATEGQLSRITFTPPQPGPGGPIPLQIGAPVPFPGIPFSAFQDQRSYDGWKHENP